MIAMTWKAFNHTYMRRSDAHSGVILCPAFACKHPLHMCDRCLFFSSRRRHTSLTCDWSPDVCSSDLAAEEQEAAVPQHVRAHDPLQGARREVEVAPRSEERRVGKECRCRCWPCQ